MTTDPHAPDGAAPDGAPPADAEHRAAPGAEVPAPAGYLPYRDRRTGADPDGARGGAEVPRSYAGAWRRPWYLNERWWLVGAIVAIAVVGAAVVALAGGGGGGGDDEGGRAEAAPAAGAADAAATGPVDTAGQVHAVGQTAHTRHFDLTVLRVSDPYRSTTRWDATQRPGHHLVAVEVEATNTSDQQQLLSPLAGTGLTDAQDRPWGVAIAGVDRPRLDGYVAAGETRQGWIVFEVADDATDLQLRLKGNLSATGSLFDLA